MFSTAALGYFLRTRHDNSKKLCKELSSHRSKKYEKEYYVYLLSNTSKMIYTGMTGNLERRIYEHKNKRVEGFTKKYNLHKLVYYDSTDDVGYAIKREKQIKGWGRKKKIALIESMNPKWEDLAKNWFS